MTWLRKNASFLSFVFIFLGFRASFADQYMVPSGSMLPTIQLGDRLLVSRVAYDVKVPLTEKILWHRSDPQRGDIIVFRGPENDLTLVKRLIGLPGDHLVIRNGFVAVNGTLLTGDALAEDRFVRGDVTEFDYTEQVGGHSATVHRIPEWARGEELDLIVPANQYFFMGDNRDNSHDSRAWGFVSREQLKGKALGVIWNLNLGDGGPSLDWRRIGHAFN